MVECGDVLAVAGRGLALERGRRCEHHPPHGSRFRSGWCAFVVVEPRDRGSDDAAGKKRGAALG